jgi:NADPH:quinone reductase-like Zn-dependent oxidoreductase
MALQFAVAAGANVIATTSNDQKAKRLRELGAKHVINYRQTPEWGIAAKDFTPSRHGFDIVVDVGGENTLGESVKAIRQDGLVVAAGLVAGSAKDDRPALLDALWNLCIVRGVLLGTRDQFIDMNRFVEEKRIELAVDNEVFSLEDAKKAYVKLEAQKHFAKVIIEIK